MKKFIFTLAALCAFIVAQAQNNNFEVNFDIKGMLSSKVSATVFGDKDLVSLNMDERGGIPVENGKIKLSGTTQTAAVIRFFLGNEDKRVMKMVGNGYVPVKSANLWVIVYPGAKLTVTGDMTDLKYVNIFPAEGTGTGENDIFAKLNREMIPLISEGGDLSIEPELNPSTTPERIAQIKVRSEEIDKALSDIREKFVNQYPSSIAALWLMEDMLIRSQISPAALEAPLAKVDKKYHNNYFYQTVKGRVEGAKSAAVGAKCPEIKAMDQFGKEFSMAEIKGKYIILDFWGTWCGPCLSGMPHMKAFRDAHADKVQIVGVANDKDVEKWKKCIEQNKMNWPNVMQGKGEQDYVAKFNVQGFPTKILVSPQGIILHRESGEGESFYKKVEELIK